MLDGLRPKTTQWPLRPFTTDCISSAYCVGHLNGCVVSVVAKGYMYTPHWRHVRLGKVGKG